MHVRLSRTNRLARKGGHIIVLCKGDKIVFDGCLEIQVLVGLVNVHGYTVISTHPPLPLFSPITSPQVPITVIDPHSLYTGHKLRPHVLPLLSGVIFISNKDSLSLLGHVYVDLEYRDIVWLNSLRDVEIAAVCVVWNLDSSLVTGLQSIPNCGLLRASFHQRRDSVPTTFTRIKNDNRSESTQLRIQIDHLNTIKDIIDYKGGVVLVCGDVCTGKSTFCRYLINTFLNKYEKVAFLECDVGQTEFTVAAVTALHVLTRPVFGPPFVGQRKPYKAFYFGHVTPGDKPRYYVHLIHSLYSLYMSDIHGNGEIPLIINTCGWTKDLGVALLIDVIRLTSPTHIVRLVSDTQRRYFQPMIDLLPFTPLTLTSTPGTVTLPSHLPHTTEEQWYMKYVPKLKAPHVPEKRLGNVGNTPLIHNLPDHIVQTHSHTAVTNRDHNTDHSTTKTDQNMTNTTQKQQTTTACHRLTKPVHQKTTSLHKGTTPSNQTTTPLNNQTKQTTDVTKPSGDNTTVVPMEFSEDESTDDVIYIESSDSSDSECDVEIIGYQPPPPLTTVTTRTPSQPSEGSKEEDVNERRVCGQKRRKVSRIRGSGLRKGAWFIPRPEQVEWNYQAVTTTISSEHWVEVERCMLGKWVKVLAHDVKVLQAAPGVRRRKNSSLMRKLAMVAHFSPLISGRGDHTHFLDDALVMQVPWKEMAIHVLHKQVPHSDMMYTMKGNFIALGRVDRTELMDLNVDGGGVVKFLRSHTPIIEFLGMGIFRGSSPEKEMYYVTTPLMVTDPVAMDTVNVLVMGEADSIFGFSKTTPTTSLSFEHITIGRLAWKRSN